MKKTIVALFLIGSVLPIKAYSHDNDVALIAGLVGLALIVGDGHTSLGIHFDNGHYNYRGNRYSNRAAYLRAVARYENERRYYNRLDNFYRYNYRYDDRRRYNNFTYRDNYSNDRSRYNNRSSDNDRSRGRDSRTDSDRSRNSNDREDGNRRSR